MIYPDIKPDIGIIIIHHDLLQVQLQGSCSTNLKYTNLLFFVDQGASIRLVGLALLEVSSLLLTVYLSSNQ
jgi:hypothetical protein